MQQAAATTTDAAGTTTTSPLIQKAQELFENNGRTGLCIFLTCARFCTGPNSVGSDFSAGPQWIHFDRRFQSGVSEFRIINRLYYDIREDHVGGDEVQPEVWEAGITACNEMDLCYEAKSNIHRGAWSELDYGVDEDEGQPGPPPSNDPHYIMEALVQQCQSLDADAFHLIQRPGPRAITITNKDPDSNAESDHFWAIFRILQNS